MMNCSTRSHWEGDVGHWVQPRSGQKWLSHCHQVYKNQPDLWITIFPNPSVFVEGGVRVLLGLRKGSKKSILNGCLATSPRELVVDSLVHLNQAIVDLIGLIIIRPYLVAIRACSILMFALRLWRRWRQQACTTLLAFTLRSGWRGWWKAHKRHWRTPRLLGQLGCSRSSNKQARWCCWWWG
jgi:hypothetical protein